MWLWFTLRGIPVIYYTITIFRCPVWLYGQCLIDRCDDAAHRLQHSITGYDMAASGTVWWLLGYDVYTPLAVWLRRVRYGGIGNNVLASPIRPCSTPLTTKGRLVRCSSIGSNAMASPMRQYCLPLKVWRHLCDVAVVRCGALRSAIQVGSVVFLSNMLLLRGTTPRVVNGLRTTEISTWKIWRKSESR